MKQVRIISLGEIVTPNIMKTLQAFTLLIAQKKSADSKQIGLIIGNVLKQNLDRIDQFKLGSLNESKFTEQMIEELEKATGIKLTTGEFNLAWNAMNPKYNQFKDLLNQ